MGSSMHTDSCNSTKMANPANILQKTIDLK